MTKHNTLIFQIMLNN